MPTTSLPPTKDFVRIIPLGGLGEIGMNCLLVEYAGDIIMVDAGQMMPDEEMLGVDYVIPDVAYVEQNRSRFKAIVLTHAHEDHVGALPYILPKFPGIKVYGSELTVELLKEKFKEHGLRPNFTIIEPRVKFKIGEHFEIEPINVTHSMIDSMALAIRTPLGVIVHSGDYKMDPNPPDGVAFDHFAFARYAEGEDEGVLCLLGDSTNVDRKGCSPSETDIVKPIAAILRDAPRQVIFGCFASSLHRIQTVLNLAAEMGRTVIAAGLNMERNIRIASGLERIEIPGKYIDDLKFADSIPPEKRLILTTGSQGEPLAALSRMAFENHKFLSVERDDTVVLSTRFIPGNERAIYRMINQFSRRGARVFHEGNAQVHVSGHAYRDEMKHLINLTNPRYLVPLHGEFRHLQAHRAVALELGLGNDEVFVLDNGDVLEINQTKARKNGKVAHGRVLVDGKGIGDVDEVVLRDRMYLSQDGFLVVVLTIERDTGAILAGPELFTRGFVFEEESADLLKELKEVVIEAHAECSPQAREDVAMLGASVKKSLRSFIKRKMDRFPVIIPVVSEV